MREMIYMDETKERITCEIEYSDPKYVSELSDVWILRNGHVLAAYRNVSLTINKLGVEIFRNNQGFIKSLVSMGKPDEVIAIVYRNVVDEIIDKRNIGEK
jgi:hypothetical protein